MGERDVAGLRRVVGDWRAAALVALTAVATSGIVSALVGLGSKQRSLSATNTLTLVGALWTGTFGAHSGLGGQGSIAGFLRVSAEVSVGFVPLTITLVTMAATVAVFRRVTRRHTSAVDALLDAVRAGLLAAVPMLVVALLLRSTHDDLVHDLPAADVPGVRLHAGPHAGAAFLLTFVTVTAVLAITVLLRRDWLETSLARRAHDWLVAPLAALAWLLCLTPAAGGLVALVLLLTGRGPFERLQLTGGFDARDWLAVAVLVVAYAANIGIWALTLGTAGQLQFSAAGLGQHAEVGRHLTYFTGDQVQEPSLWICVVIAPALLAISAYVVTRRARDRPDAWRGLALWWVALLGLVPLMLHWSALHLSARSTGLQPVGGVLHGLLSGVDCAGSSSAVCSYLPPGLLQQATDAADALSSQQSAALTVAIGPDVLATTVLVLVYAALIGVATGLLTRARARRAAPAGNAPSRA